MSDVPASQAKAVARALSREAGQKKAHKTRGNKSLGGCAMCKKKSLLTSREAAPE